MKDEEKKSCINESENAEMAAEPVGTAVRDDVSAQGYDIDKWPGMPLVGPANIDEMNARIDQAEQEMDHDNGFSIVVVRVLNVIRLQKKLEIL